jgi:excisionase family DNA binding protein
MAEDPMLNPKQVAEILGVHPKTVHQWLRSGRLQGTKISYRAWRIPRPALDAFIAGNSNARLRQQPENTIGNDKEAAGPIPPDKEGEVKGPAASPVLPGASPQAKMKHYIRDIMGEQPHED